MKFFVSIVALSLFFQTDAVRGSLMPSLRSFRSYNQSSLSRLVPCTQELQSIFEECDARASFQVLAEDYLNDSSVGKKAIRDISVFQALARSDVARMRDLFHTRLDIVAHLWMMKHKVRTLDEHRLKSFHRYLSTGLFDEHHLPFEITYPKNLANVPNSFFYFGKTIRSVFDDATRAERIAFEEKKRELSGRLEKVVPGTGIAQVHEEYLALIQNYYSYAAYEQRVLLTADQIAGYATRLMESADAIDGACESLKK